METDLDALSNSVQDAIEAGKYDEAEELCRRLLLEYPDMLDGHARLAKVREAQGRFQEAAEHYEKALLVIQAHPEGTDAGTVQWLTGERNRVLAKAKG